MKIQCKGVWTDKFAPFDISLKIGRATVLPPQKNYHSGEPIHGKEITFPCNIHDIDISEGNFTITLQVKDDSLAGYEEDIIGLSFLLPPHLKGKYRFSNVTLMDKNSAQPLTDMTNFCYGQPNAWVIGEKEIIYPPFGKIKQMLISKGVKDMPDTNTTNTKESEVVQKSEPVALDTIIASYQEELAKNNSNDYEKE